MYKQENKHAHINSQNPSPLFVKSSTKGRKQIKTIKIYVWYTFMKKRDVKLTPLHTCITWRRDDKILTHIKYNIQCISGDVKPPTHVYHIKMRGQALQYVNYTQYESIYREDVKLPLHIDKTYQQILKPVFKTNFWNFLKSTK